MSRIYGQNLTTEQASEETNAGNKVTVIIIRKDFSKKPDFY